MRYEFEFDDAKSSANRIKHGVDFVEAQTLWLDGNLLILPARSQAEDRHLVIGMMDGKHWAAIVTYREDKVRLISVRRARPKEVDAYEGK